MGNAITGTLPAALGNLSNLLEFSGHENYLEGTIPSSFGGLKKISDLTLQLNMLTGSLPGELSGLTALTGLDLSNNHLSGFFAVEFGQWVRILTLQLHDNTFSGPMPDLQYPMLEQWSIQNNAFTGPLDIVFNKKHYDHLVNVDFSGERFPLHINNTFTATATTRSLPLPLPLLGLLPILYCNHSSPTVTLPFCYLIMQFPAVLILNRKQVHCLVARRVVSNHNS